MTKMKKILAVSMALVMLAVSAPLTVVALGNATEGFSNGESWTRDSDSVGKINSYLNYTGYNFMQTKDNEEFTFSPEFFLQKNAGAAYAIFNSFKLFTDGHYEGDEKVEEYPEITETEPNMTNDFLNNYGAAFNWTAGNDNAAETGFPDNSFGIAGSFVDVGGCKRYYWNCEVNFHGNDSGTTGEISTGFYWNLDWTYAYNSTSATTHRQVRLGVKVKVTDVRPLIAKVAEAKEIIAAGVTDNNTQSYIDALANVTANVPGNMLSGAAYYSQAAVDEQFKRVEAYIDGAADYTKYNETYTAVSAYLSEDDKYTLESLDAFSQKIAAIDSALSRGLKIAEQSIVDVAAEALKNAVTTELVAKNLTNENGWNLTDDGNSYGKSPLKASITPTSFKYMQTADNENFSLPQELYMEKTTWMNMNFRSLCFDGVTTSSPCENEENGCAFISQITENKTADFLSRLNSATAVNANGLTELANWTFNSKSTGASFVTDGKLTTCNFPYNAVGDTLKTYYADTNMSFKGNGASETGEINTNFVWKFSWEYKDVIGTSTYTQRHIHLPVTITVTDVRPLIEKYNEIKGFLNNLGDNESLYPASSISALRTALSGIATDMLRGTTYYEQSAVDEKLGLLTTAYDAVEYKADYSEYEQILADAQDIISSNNADNYYSASAFEDFKAQITEIDEGLNKNLGVSSQSVVDSAAADIRSALDALSAGSYCDYTELDAAIALSESIDESVIYTEASKSALDAALNEAKSFQRGLVKGTDDANQNAIDNLVNELVNAYNNISKKADYTSYNEAKTAADALTNADGRYDDDDFTAYKEAVTAADDALNKDLADTEENRGLIADAKAALEAAKNTLDANMNYFVSYYNVGGELINTETVKATVVSALSMPVLPENTAEKAFRWEYADSTAVKSTDNVSADTAFYIDSEDKIICIDDYSELTVADGIIKGLNAGNNTVAELLGNFDNDETYVEIKSFSGELLSETDKVGTGATVTLKSKFTGTVYDTKTVLVMGDVNGDGVVDAADYAISKSVTLGNTQYTADEALFEAANDMDCDGVIDVIDTFYLGKLVK